MIIMTHMRRVDHLGYLQRESLAAGRRYRLVWTAVHAQESLPSFRTNSDTWAAERCCRMQSAKSAAGGGGVFFGVLLFDEDEIVVFSAVGAVLAG
jgi:hypothetical protein